jgi:hypothetical protein
MTPSNFGRVACLFVFCVFALELFSLARASNNSGSSKRELAGLQIQQTGFQEQTAILQSSVIPAPNSRASSSSSNSATSTASLLAQNSNGSSSKKKPITPGPLPEIDLASSPSSSSSSASVSFSSPLRRSSRLQQHHDENDGKHEDVENGQAMIAARLARLDSMVENFEARFSDALQKFERMELQTRQKMSENVGKPSAQPLQTMQKSFSNCRQGDDDYGDDSYDSDYDPDDDSSSQLSRENFDGLGDSPISGATYSCGLSKRDLLENAILMEQHFVPDPVSHWLHMSAEFRAEDRTAPVLFEAARMAQILKFVFKIRKQPSTAQHTVLELMLYMNQLFHSYFAAVQMGRNAGYEMLRAVDMERSASLPARLAQKLQKRAKQLSQFRNDSKSTNQNFRAGRGGARGGRGGYRGGGRGGRGGFNNNNGFNGDNGGASAAAAAGASA